MIGGFFRKTRETVKDINEKYKTPHMKMTRAARFSLGLLRFYLLFLVAIMVYKFVITALHK
jgi:hypothetical protein